MPRAGPPRRRGRPCRRSRTDEEEGVEEATLTPERYAQLGAREQFVLVASENGFGKRTSSYEYRVTGRGGSGIVAMAMAQEEQRRRRLRSRSRNPTI